jgi:hypothetical protein
MQIFNTLTRQKEEFVPQVPGEYRIYVCGPTVYNYIHIGNARPLIVFDTLRRYLEYRGNKVIYVSNITDIDDKLIKKGQEEGTSMKEVAQRFEAEYLKDAAGLNCKKPTVQPRATEHIQQILDIVKDLIESGHAYVADLLDMLGSAGLDGGLFAVQTGGILEVLGLEALGDFLHGSPLFLALLDELVVDVGDVGDVDDLVAAVLKVTAQGIEDDERAGVADVDIVVDGGAADVDAVLARHLRHELFLLAGQGVEDLHS